MFNLDKAFLNEKAAESDFIRDNLEKVYRLTDLLAFIFEEPILSDNLVLKGGTAINLTVFHLPRLSVDIDLDLNRRCSRDEMLALREEIDAILLRFMAASGYSQDSRKQKESHALSSRVFYYRNAGGNPDNIKVEINYSMRQHILPVRKATVNADVLETRFQVNALAPIELFGSKIKALTERTAARDLYDVHNMLCQGVFDESEMDLLRKCVLFYRAVGSTGAFQEDICLDGISNITYPTIRQTLLPVLRKGEKIDLEHMKKEVHSFTAELLNPTDQERGFLREFAEGRYEPSLLFDDPEIIERISDHPMALWKCESIRQAQGQKETQGYSMTML